MPKNSDPIFIPDDFKGYGPSHFLIPAHYENCLTNVLIPHGLVNDRVKKMASDFYASIEDRSKPILALCVLKSASQFFNDFIHELKIIASNLSGEDEVFKKFSRNL